MSPRSLLFSSDQETLRLVNQALTELGLKVESCHEIFAALRCLTSRMFDLIVVDWDEGPEATFLLKTARELKSNQNALVVIIGRKDATAALQQAGAEVILSKPITPDETRHVLLTSKEFVSRMRAWLPPEQVQQTIGPVAGKESRMPPVSAPAPVLVSHAPATRIPATRIPATRLPATQLSATHASAVRVSAPQPLHVEVTPGPTLVTFGGFLRDEPPSLVMTPRSARTSRRKTGGRQTTILRVAAIAVAFFAVGYVFSRPLTKVGNQIVQIFRGTPEQRPDWGHEAPSEVQAASEQVPVEDPEPVWRPEKASNRIRVTPVRDGVPQAPAASSPVTRQPSTPEQPAPQPEQVAALASVPANPPSRIPESMSTPFPGVATMRNVASKIGPALLDALQPITVPEQLSEKLLLDRVEPSYPQKALQAGLQGPVVLQAWIGRDGKIRDLKLVRGSLLLGQAACEAVKQWRYKPYLLNGEAVEAQTFVTVDFKLP